jgi:hypothetical protein
MHGSRKALTQTRHDSMPLESPRRGLPQAPNLKPKAAIRTPSTTDKQLPPRPSSANERHGRAKRIQESESPVLRSQSLQRNFSPNDSPQVKPAPMPKLRARKPGPPPNSAIEGLSTNYRIKQIITQKGIETINIPCYRGSEDSLGSIGYVTPNSTTSAIRGAMQESDMHLQYKGSQNGAERPIGSSGHHFAINSYPTLEQEYRRNCILVKNDPNLWYKPRYTSGPIVTDPTFGLYAVPAMTAMDVLCHTVAITDEQIVDDIVDFFESYQFAPIISDLDNYWTKSESPEAEAKVPTPITSPLGYNAPKPLAANSFLMQVDPPTTVDSSAFSDSSSGHSQAPRFGSSALSFFRGGGSGSGNKSSIYSSSHVSVNEKADITGSTTTLDQHQPSSAAAPHRVSMEESLGSSDHHPLLFRQGSSSAPPFGSLPSKPPPAASSSLGRTGSRASSDWSPRSLSNASSSAAAAAVAAAGSAQPSLTAVLAVAEQSATGTVATPAGVSGGRSIFKPLRLGQSKRNNSASSGGSVEKPQSPRSVGSGQTGGRFSVKKLLDMGASSSAYDVYSQGR